MVGYSLDMLKKRHDISGLAKKAENSGVEEKYWVSYEGKDFLYKQDDTANFGFNELFCSYILRHIGVNGVNVYPARDDESKGVIIESFLNENVIQTIDFDDAIEMFCSDSYKVRLAERNAYGYANCLFTIDDLKDIEKQAQRHGYAFSQDNYKAFKEMVLADYLLSQEDRYGRNIEFLLERRESGRVEIKLAPIYDNGFTLAREGYGNGYRINDPKKIVKTKRCLLSITNEQKKQDETSVEAIGRNIAKYLLEDESLMKIYKKFKNIDFDKAIKNICIVGRYKKVYENETEYLKSVLKEKVELIEQAIRELGTNIQNEGREEI